MRIVNFTQNSMNSSIRNDNKSGVIGVGRKRKKWMAKITYYKKVIYLGCFENFEDAVKARILAEKQYFGEFAPQKHLYKQYGIE